MSTSITQQTWQIVIHDQLELHSRLRYWSVAVWTDYESNALAQCHWQNDNFDWEKYELSTESLNSLVLTASAIIKGEQK